jgi:hypothetical protein
MNKEIANKLLDKVRDGQNFSFEQISAALYATGDIYAAMRGEGMEEALQGEGEGTGQGESPELVDCRQERHSQDSWTGWSRYLTAGNEQ